MCKSRGSFPLRRSLSPSRLSSFGASIHNIRKNVRFFLLPTCTDVQSDPSGCSLGSVDIKTKVAFKCVLLLFWFWCELPRAREQPARSPPSQCWCHISISPLSPGGLYAARARSRYRCVWGSRPTSAATAASSATSRATSASGNTAPRPRCQTWNCEYTTSAPCSVRRLRDFLIFTQPLIPVKGTMFWKGLRATSLPLRFGGIEGICGMMLRGCGVVYIIDHLFLEPSEK